VRILAPNVRHRRKVVPATPGAKRRSHAHGVARALGKAHREGDQHAPITWMAGLRRVFATHLSLFPRLLVVGDTRILSELIS
jgi:hypothetical protein